MKTKIFHLTMALILAVMLIPALFLPVTPARASPGEVTVILRPMGNGTHTEFDTVEPSGNHWEAVDEETADGDLSYIEEDASDKRDTFALTNSGLTGGCIKYVKVWARAKRIDKDNDYMTIMIRSGGTDYYGETEHLGSDYSNKPETWTTDPFTKLPWTWTAVDALEAGVTTKVDWDSGARVTQVWVEVRYCPLCATLRPDGAGTYTEFDTVYPSGTHWAAVDEVVADGDDTYIKDDGGKRDTFALDDSGLDTDDCINYVIVGVRAKRIDSSNRRMKIMIRSGTMDATGDLQYLDSSYKNYSEKWTTDPDTGDPWTTAAVDALEAGVTTDVGSYNGAQVTQVWVVVCAEPAITLTMAADGAGTVDPSPGVSTHCPGDIEITATPDCPAAFAGWTTGDGDMSEIYNPTFSKTTLTLDKDKTVTGYFVSPVATQMAMVLDGSGSVSGEDFVRIKEGLADAVNDDLTDLGCFARDGTLELTVVQFGDERADLEVGPVAITSGNAATVADKIRGISKIGGYTPLACGIYLAADLLAGDPNNNLAGTPWEGLASCVDSDKQVINIVTDGEPNRCCNYDDDLYESDKCGDPPTAYNSTVDARDYLIDLLGMDDDPQDRILAETRNSAEWFRTEIVWPQEGVIATPPPPFPEDKGWVYVITSFGGNCTEWVDATTYNVTTATVNNPDEALSDDADYTDYASFENDDATCEYSGYDFSSIPSGATIDGIQVRLDGKASGKGSDRFYVELWYGTDWTSTGNNWDPSSYSWNKHSFGSPNDDWGHTWTKPELDTLKVRVKWDDTPNGKDGYLDWVPVAVCYHVDYPEEFYDVFCAKLRPPASITIVKETDPDTDTTTQFDFTGELGSFNLTGNGDSKKFSNLAPDDYTVTETVPLGWILTSISCDDDSDPSNGATITVNPGDDITCTFTNTYWEPGEVLPAMFIDYDVLTYPPVVEPGGQVTYQIMVVNSGSGNATNVSIWAMLPAGFTYDSMGTIVEVDASRSSTDPSHGDTTPTWGEWLIQSGGSVTIPFTVDVGTGVGPGTYDSTAYADGDNFDEIDDKGTEGQDEDTPPGQDPEPDEDVTIREVLPPPAVGGEAYPVNKIAILAPWIAIAMAIIAGSITWLTLKRRRA